MTTTLIGNNIALIMYGVYSAKIIERLLINNALVNPSNGFLIFLVQTVVSSLIVLVLAEFIPKAIFRSIPNTILAALSYPFMLFYYAFYPLVRLLDFLSKGILKNILGVKQFESVSEYSRHDLMHFVSESNTKDEDSGEPELDTQIFKNAIEFHSVKVRECMIPRTEIEAIDVSESIETLRELFVETGLSKVLVFKGNIDNIIGYVHIVDLYKQPKSIDKIVMPIIIASDAMTASDLLRQLIDRHKSIAVVVDEFGGTAGVATIEDIIEEIIGDIEDEHDQDDLTEKQVSANEYIFSARLDIDYLNEKYNLRLPEGDYDTLGGYILYINQSIPQPNDIIEAAPFQFTVISSEQTKLNEIRLLVLDQEK